MRLTKKAKKQLLTRISHYLLTDYEFLQEYIVQNIQDTQMGDHKQQQIQFFHAKIINSNQFVKFIKIPFNQSALPRFAALYQLYQKGIILADNIFILDEADSLFFYIIQAELDKHVHQRLATNQQIPIKHNSQNKSINKNKDQNKIPYKTLNDWLIQKNPEFQERKKVYERIKILLSQIHSTGQTYNNLSCKKIIIDEQCNVFLAPYNLLEYLQIEQAYQRSYFSPQILQYFQNRDQLAHFQGLQKSYLIKNDIWAFGCITAQIFLYCMPIFYHPTLEIQLVKIKEFVRDIESRQKYRQIWMHRNIGNTIYNCLNIDKKKRKISQETPIRIKMDQLNQQVTKQKKLKIQQNIQVRKDDTQQMQLTIKFLNILIQVSQNQPTNQLRINIYLDKQHSLFFDTNQSQIKNVKNQKKVFIQINKTITIRNSLQVFTDMLKKPILLQLQRMGREQQQPKKIRVNLYSLILLNENNQQWNKPLIGTYSCIKNDSNQITKLKLSCYLKQLANKKQNDKIIYEKLKEYQKNQVVSVQVKKQEIIKQRMCSEKVESTKVIKDTNRFNNLNEKLQKIAEKWAKKQQKGQNSNSMRVHQLQNTSSELGSKIQQILLKRQIQL